MAELKIKLLNAKRSLEDNFRIKHMFSYYSKDTHNMLKKMNFDLDYLSSDQKKEIDNLYKSNFGSKISYDSHNGFTQYTKSFDARYIPQAIYFSYIETRLNPNRNFIKVLEDKNFVNTIAKAAGVNTATTIWGNSNGVNISDSKFASKPQIIENIAKYESLFVKPSIESCGGKGCNLYNRDLNDDPELLVDEILNRYNENFVVSTVCKNSASIKALHPYSLNTFRVVTYILDNQIYHMPALLRIGRNKSVVDNASSGGILVGIQDDGALNERAFNTKLDWTGTSHPDTNIEFADYKINHFDKIIDACYRMHAEVPELGIVNWDIILDENEEPTLIEVNCATSGGCRLSQFSHGKGGFRDNTEKILRLARR